MKRSVVGVIVGMALQVMGSAVGAEILPQFATEKGTISIAGGTAHIPVMNAAGQRIMATNPNIRVTVEGGGTGVGVQKVGEGMVNIGNTGRALSTDEVARYGLVSFPFAVDGVTVVLHPKNPLLNLSAAQVQDIFSGKVSNWKEIGGTDQSITLYARDEASGTREVFWAKLLEKGEVADKANIVASNGAMKVAVGQDPGAIGYMGIGLIDATVKVPTLDGVEPSQENAKSETYKVVRKLYMNTKGEPQGLTKLFVDYVTSKECADIISQSGYIPLN